MSDALRKPPAAVVRGKALADRVRGRDLLFKASNYMGPVHVDEASCSYRWFRLKMTTRPWREGARPQVLAWEVPPIGVTETPVRLSVRVHHLVGMLIHDRERIEAIEALRQSGATLDQLLAAFNFGRWLREGPADFSDDSSRKAPDE
jgi:hypothetical protein